MSILELRQALRIFRREPALAAATAVLTLTLGIGANTALFAWSTRPCCGRCRSPTPIGWSCCGTATRRTGLTKPDVAIGDFVDLRARQRSLVALAGFGGYQSTFFGAGEPLRVEGAGHDRDALRLLRVRPALGRLLEDGDARKGAPPVVLVSHEFWRTQLGSDARAVALDSARRGTRRPSSACCRPASIAPGMPATDSIVTQALPATAPAERRAGSIYGLGRLRDGGRWPTRSAELARCRSSSNASSRTRTPARDTKPWPSATRCSETRSGR